MPFLLLLLGLTGGVVATPLTAQERPRVHIVATGGTISNRDGGRLTADEIVGLVPAADRYAALTAEQFSNTASGALTIAQDRDSSVVWGMPRVAVEMGGASEVLPLARIGQALLRPLPVARAGFPA